MTEIVFSMLFARAERTCGAAAVDNVGERGVDGREIVGERGLVGRGGIVSHWGMLM